MIVPTMRVKSLPLASIVSITGSVLAAKALTMVTSVSCRPVRNSAPAALAAGSAREDL